MELSVKLSVISLLRLLLPIDGLQNRSRKKVQLVQVHTGKSVTIVCPTKPDTPIFSVTWTFGCESEDLMESQHYKSRTNFIATNLQMTINNLTEEDSGYYQCIVTENGSRVSSIGAILDVTPTPDPEDNKSDFSVTMYVIVGVEACIILILLIVQYKNLFSGSSERKNKDEATPAQELCYAEVRITEMSHRPRTMYKEEKTIYVPIKLQQ